LIKYGNSAYLVGDMYNVMYTKSYKIVF